MILNVTAIASLLGGITVLARVPRMAKGVWSWLAAPAVFALSVFLYDRMIDPAAKNYLSLFFMQHFAAAGESAIVWVLGVVGCIAGLISYFCPRCGLKPVVGLLGVVTALVVFGILYGPGTTEGGERKPPIWPAVLSGAAFLYLWWLAALIFDLVFVWHRYIRFSSAVKILRSFKQPRKRVGGKDGKEPVSTMPRAD